MDVVKALEWLESQEIIGGVNCTNCPLKSECGEIELYKRSPCQDIASEALKMIRKGCKNG